MIRWGQTRFSAADMPPVVMEFGLPSGVGEGTVGNWKQYSEHYRCAAGGISEDYFKKFLFFTFDRAASRDYSSLVGFAVGTLPSIYAGGEIRLRTGDEQGRPVVGFLGHQRSEKGYHLIPDVLRLLLGKDVRAGFLIHNSDMRETATAQELRGLAMADARVRFEQRTADHGYWNRLLDNTDICALPYEPNRYAASVSAVAAEAVSCGLPIISPKGTTMKTLAERYQNNSTAITDWTVEAIADAIIEAVRDFPELAQSAYEGAERWVLENGASAFASRLLAFAESRAPARLSPPALPFEPVMRCVSSIARAKIRLLSN